MQQQTPIKSLLFAALLMLTLLAAAAAAAGSLMGDEDRSSDSTHRQFHGHIRSHRKHEHASRGGRPLHHHRRSSWRAANHWCRRRSSAIGLWQLSDTSRRDFDAAAERLAELAASWAPGCYWLGNAFDEEGRLHWLVENRFASTSRCVCVRGGGDDHRLKLRRVSCHRRLPFHCQSKAARKTTTTTTKTRSEAAVNTTTAPTKTSASAATTMSFEDAADDATSDEDDPDEAVEHGKFPEFELGPDGHPKGWLPPWRALTSTTTKTAATAVGAATETPPSAPEQAAANETASTAGGGGGFGPLQRLLATDQRSEFVTLLVLYSIVAVICLVLLVLCLLRCCRGYCGRAKVRYVRQVDADDIPRFMPSSWA